MDEHLGFCIEAEAKISALMFYIEVDVTLYVYLKEQGGSYVLVIEDCLTAIRQITMKGPGLDVAEGLLHTVVAETVCTVLATALGVVNIPIGIASALIPMEILAMLPLGGGASGGEDTQNSVMNENENVNDLYDSEMMSTDDMDVNDLDNESSMAEYWALYGESSDMENHDLGMEEVFKEEYVMDIAMVDSGYDEAEGADIANVIDYGYIFYDEYITETMGQGSDSDQDELKGAEDDELGMTSEQVDSLSVTSEDVEHNDESKYDFKDLDVKNSAEGNYIGEILYYSNDDSDHYKGHGETGYGMESIAFVEIPDNELHYMRYDYETVDENAVVDSGFDIIDVSGSESISHVAEEIIVEQTGFAIVGGDEGSETVRYITLGMSDGNAGGKAEGMGFGSDGSSFSTYGEEIQGWEFNGGDFQKQKSSGQGGGFGGGNLGFTKITGNRGGFAGGDSGSESIPHVDEEIIVEHTGFATVGDDEGSGIVRYIIVGMSDGNAGGKAEGMGFGSDGSSFSTYGEEIQGWEFNGGDFQKQKSSGHGGGFGGGNLGYTKITGNGGGFAGGDYGSMMSTASGWGFYGDGNGFKKYKSHNKPSKKGSWSK
ncbi:uncharacterized protein [Dendrobates tinctorius]|uniref:uncharacterized protein n=1 Tax=Dendrobates tinctorius TaxID=92724 RepID=UPI003CC94D90